MTTLALDFPPRAGFRPGMPDAAPGFRFAGTLPARIAAPEPESAIIPRSIPLSSGREAVVREMRELDREEQQIGARLLAIEARRKTRERGRAKLRE